MTAKQKAHYHMSPSEPHKFEYENERRQVERREMKSDGFAYISTVGWICRRESCRRDGDNLLV